jgi:hypothetical protein
MKTCIPKSPSQETDSEHQRAKYLEISILISLFQLQEAKDPTCGIENVYSVYACVLQYMP